MTEKKRLQIGLMIHHLENEYASEILKGAIAAAEELDINLILLPGRGINAVEDDEKYSIYDYQYNVIYNYVSERNLDGLLVSVGTVGSYISREEMAQFLHSYDPLPLLTMEVEFPGYPCIRFNTNAMKLAVEHLIHRHGCRKIGFVSGPMGNQDAMERLQCYRAVLEENHIPYDCTKVVYGNFSETSEEVVRNLLDLHPDLEAICFANDKMCIGGYEVFKERKMRVGEDILVTGFDDSEVATSLKPMLTTVRTNISSMGYQSVQALVELIQTGKTRSRTLDARLIVRESCDLTEEQIQKLADHCAAEEIVGMIFNKYIGDLESTTKTRFIQRVWELLTKEFQAVCSHEPLPLAEYQKEISEMFDQTDVIPIQVPLLKKVVTYAKEFAVQICREQPENLLAVARAGAGVNNIPIDRCSEEGIVVFNTPGANANAVKELVICALLLASRKVVQGANWVKGLKGTPDIGPAAEKGKSTYAGPEIAGKKLGIIGLGAIGVKVANAAVGLDMEVWGYDPYLSVDGALKLDRSVKHVTELDEIFANCDYITIHVPLNADTKNTISAEAIEKMKDGVRVINLARGELVDTKAMAKALESGKVAAYVSDFASDEILEQENAITLPHLGASTPESEDNCAKMAVYEITEYLEKGTIRNSVNFPNLKVPYEGGYRICMIHKNIPNMIASITSAVRCNIENMGNRSKGDYAYTIIDTAEAPTEANLDELRAIEGMISVRTI